MKKIYSILVAYNPDLDELNQAVNRLKKQTDMVIVCNNSGYDVKFEDEEVKVFNFGENLGIAKAQSIGMKWAFENGADFILQMDQDSIPNDDLVKKLLECYEKLTIKEYKIGLVGPQDYDKDTKELNKARLKKGTFIDDTNYVSLEQTLSSGSLIPKCVYDIVGSMDDELFIDAVDNEYCWRIRKNGFLIIKNNDALLAHKLGDGKQKILGFLNVGVPSPIRHYYQIRNTLLLARRDYVPTYWKYSMLVKVVFKLFVYPFTLNRGFERFKYITKGIKDGILGRNGKIN
ncbi:glycosyltransferase family 2 protein [Aliarcobacter butzleri]|uniref:Glycosyltransferase family 2 protein n=1 Tax=Aliarcobacter butzleri TaxID=28197 RepID=A0AAW7Q5F7_9BACT|nr:glycosyltransferase family 2 protein [Aliarcobacter butzleri]MDN5114343.1 glycosyltransferase family 2 protein [Aliarcobacter butzleri]